MQTGHKPVATAETAEQRQGLLCGVVDFFQNGSDLLGAPKTQLLEARPASEVASPSVVELRLAFVFTADAEMA